MTPSTFIIREPIPMRGGPNDKPPKPPLIEIPRVMSQPADPDAPSFLTLLPAEIRNEIYCILFKRDVPVMIVDREGQLPISEGEEEEDDPSQTHHDLDHGIQLLLTCRQIYHEAIEIMYSGNTFCVTASQNQHNHRVQQITNAAEFIRSIGSHARLLKRLLIETGRACPYYCPMSKIPDWLPLLSAIWARSSMDCEIVFDSIGTGLSSRVHSDLDWEYDSIDNTYTTHLLQALVQFSPLAGYGRFERLLDGCHITIFEKIFDSIGLGQYFTLRNPSPGSKPSRHLHMDLKRRFLTNDAGDKVRLAPSYRVKKCLSSLPPALFKHILDLVLEADQGLHLNVAARTFNGRDTALLSVSRQTRHDTLSYFESVYFSGHITWMMETDEPRTSFNHFKSYLEWATAPDPFPWLTFAPNQMLPERTSYVPVMALHFNVDTVAPRDLRIDIQSLINFSSQWDTRTVVRLTTGRKTGPESQWETHEVELQTLRREYFLMLSWMLTRWPEMAEMRRPDVWIDGTGAVVEVVSSTVGTDDDNDNTDGIEDGDGTAQDTPTQYRCSRSDAIPHDKQSIWPTGLRYASDVAKNEAICGRYRENSGIKGSYTCGALFYRNTLGALWRSMRTSDWSEDGELDLDEYHRAERSVRNRYFQYPRQ